MGVAQILQWIVFKVVDVIRVGGKDGVKVQYKLLFRFGIRGGAPD